MTLILTRQDVQSLLGFDECIAAVERPSAFTPKGGPAASVLAIRSRKGASTSRRPAGASRCISPQDERQLLRQSSPHGLPAIQGVIVLCAAMTAARSR